MPENSRQNVEAMLGYDFMNPNLLWEALQAAGSAVASIGGRRIDEGNKRLAIVGDAAMKLALCDAWFATSRPRGKLNDFQGQNLSLTDIKVPSRTDLMQCFRMPISIA